MDLTICSEKIAVSAKVSAQGNRVTGGKNSAMARRRFQTGSVKAKGRFWIGRFHDYIQLPTGKEARKPKRVNLGARSEVTESQAKRRLQPFLDVVNSRVFTGAVRIATFSEFVEDWKLMVLIHHKPSGQASANSCLTQMLVPFFGTMQLHDITGKELARFIAKESGRSPKTVRNAIGVFRMVWKTARSWNYVTHDPLFGIVLPRFQPTEERFFTTQDMKRIIHSAALPFKTFYWLFAETGLRRGEVCGLRVDDFDFSGELVRVTVKQSVWNGKIQTPKTSNAYRSFTLSPQLTSHLQMVISTWEPNPLRLLFAKKSSSAQSCNSWSPWDAQIVLEQHLQPLLAELKIEKAGFHAFRHGQSTEMDRQQVPEAVQLSRLGHAKRMQSYKHRVSQDEDAYAVTMGNVLTEAVQ